MSILFKISKEATMKILLLTLSSMLCLGLAQEQIFKWDFWELKGCPIWEWTKKGGRCLCGGFLSKLCPLNFSNPYLVCWRNIKMIPILILLIHNIGKYWSHVLVSVNLSFPENHVTNPGPALLTPTMIILCHCNFPQILQ